VTGTNLHAYLEMQMKHRLQSSIAKPLLSLLNGFYEVVPETLLSVFDFQELELLLHGLPTIDMEGIFH
jgi:hypothetical protein